MPTLKFLVWIGSSRADLQALPNEVQDEIGYALYQAQRGELPTHAKPLKGLDGVFEIVSRFNKNTYRAVYAVKFGEKIYVLHVFQKKSKTGIRTPQAEIDLIKKRWKLAQTISEKNHATVS